MKAHAVAMIVAAALTALPGLAPLHASAASAGQTSPSTGASSPEETTTLRQEGTIVKFDPKTSVLSLQTTAGTERFTLATGTRVRENGQVIALDALEKMAGRRARVRYSESPVTVASVSIGRRSGR